MIETVLRMKSKAMSEPCPLENLLPDAALLEGDGSVLVKGLQLDSRKVKEGDLFAALKGVHVNGEAFIPKAVESGAVAILAGPDAQADTPVIKADNPSRALAEISAKFYAGQPDFITAVTGTNGKSSTVEFLRQIWSRSGHEAAALGTLGVTRTSGRTDVGYTTPDAIRLHQSLQALRQEGVTHLAMEASSHGLKQYRMDGAKVSLAGFTNLTQDHLDYHPDFDDYFVSKMRLFTELLEPGATAVINVDSQWGEQAADTVEAAGHPVMRIGWRGHDLQIREITPHPSSQHIRFTLDGADHEIDLPLIGEFQTANALMAAALALHSGVSQSVVWDALASLTGVAGRLELAGKTARGAPVLVDFAHTPDGLDKLLRAVRPHTQGRIHLVFGAGGDRDPSKRDKMGAVAARLADQIIVTDDNPRSEDPALIRQAVMRGCPNADEVGDRAQAIKMAISRLEVGDCLLIAGKGHESGQIIGDRVIPFNDRDTAQSALKDEGS